MPGTSGLLLLLLLLLSAAAAKQTTMHQQKEEREVLNSGLLQESKAEGQDQDLLTAATGYGGDQHHKSGYHGSAGCKGSKGPKAQKRHKKNQYGDHTKVHYTGYHDTQGKKYKGHDDKERYYSESKKGEKGKKGHHYGSKGHHKGHKDKGFRNVYQKEEHDHTKRYYDDHYDETYYKDDHYKNSSNGNKETESSDKESKKDSQVNNSSGNLRRSPTHEELPNRVVNEKTGRALHVDKRKREDRDVNSKKVNNKPLLQEQNKMKEGKLLDKSGKKGRERKSSKVLSKGTQDTRQSKQKTNSHKKTKARKTENTRKKADKENVSRDKTLKHSDKNDDEKGRKAGSQGKTSARRTGNRKGNPGDKRPKGLNTSKDKNAKHSNNKEGGRAKKRNPQGKKNNKETRTHEKSSSPSNGDRKISETKNPREGEEKNKRRTNAKKRDSKTSELARPKDTPHIPRNARRVRSIRKSIFRRGGMRRPRDRQSLAIVRLNSKICRLKCRICLLEAERELLRHQGHDGSKSRRRRSKERAAKATKKPRDPKESEASKETKGSRESKRYQAEQAGVAKGHLREGKSHESDKKTEEKAERNARLSRQQLAKSTGGKREKAGAKMSKKEMEKRGTAAKREKVQRNSPKSLTEMDGYKTRNVNKGPAKRAQNEKQKISKPHDVKKPAKREVSRKTVPQAGRNIGRRNDKNVIRNGPSQQMIVEGDEAKKPKHKRENDSSVTKKRETEARGSQKYTNNHKRVKTRATNTGDKRDASRKTIIKPPSKLTRQRDQKPIRIAGLQMRQQKKQSRPKSVSVKNTSVKAGTRTEESVAGKE